MKFNPSIIFEDYQRDCITWARDKVAPYLALYCGGGKTFSSLALVEECDNILVVCPAFLQSDWKRNINYCYPQSSYKFSILPYSKLREDKTGKLHDNYFPSGNNAIIFDEAHYLKTSTSQRTKFTYRKGGLIDAGFSKFIFLSGTPVTNTPLDLYPYLKKFAKEFKSVTKDDFIMRYCAGQVKTFNLPYRTVKMVLPMGRSNIEEFSALVKPYIYYVGPEIIEKNLPEKYHELRIVNSQGIKKEWLRKEEEFYNLTQDHKLKSQAPGFTEYSEIRKLIAVEKTRILLPDIYNYLSLESNTVIFCWHNEVCEMLATHFKTDLVITGKTSMSRRDSIIERFNNSKKSVMIASIKSISVGKEFVSANTVIFMEMSWDSIDIPQAFKRVHRRGQKDKVKILYFVLDNSIEVRILDVLADKINFVNNVFK